MERLSPHAQISRSSRRRLARWLVGLPISVVERDLIVETLAGTHGNRTVSARLLGVSVRTLRNKISKYSAEGFHILMLHRTRHLFIRQQTAVINSIRAHLAEFGIVAPVGRKGVMELLHVVADPSDKRVPEVARACLAALGAQLFRLQQQRVLADAR